MERRHEAGESLDVHSVASFFVSRVDTEVDKRLEKLGREDLRGIAAVANARAAYQRFKELFHGERFARLRDAGVPVQRPLWASTGVKDPRYPDTKYVDGAGRARHGQHDADGDAAAPAPSISSPRARPPTRTRRADLQALAEAGIDMTDVTETLLREGIEKFVEPFDKLIAGIESTREADRHRPPEDDRVVDPRRARAGDRRARQAGPGRGRGAAHLAARTSRSGAARACRRSATGWAGSRSPRRCSSTPPTLHAFAAEVKAEGFTDAVLLGMGGSSLGPEVIRRSYGEIPDGLRLHVLDSTDPDAIARRRARDRPGEDALRRLLEVRRHARDAVAHALLLRAQRRRRQPLRRGHRSRQPADRPRHERGFRRVFENDPDIGGRYSVLSYFGLVPAALMGVDVEALLHQAQVAEQNCHAYDGTAGNSGLWLGPGAGRARRAGRDKLTFVVADADRELRALGRAADRGVARARRARASCRSPASRSASPSAYGDDRVFVYLRNEDEPDEQLDAQWRRCAQGRPADVDACRTTGGRPRPDLLLRRVRHRGRGLGARHQPVRPAQRPGGQGQHRPRCSRPTSCRRWRPATRASELLGKAEPPHYVAIMGYVAPCDELDAAVAELRAAIRDADQATTTFGYGPRFLHSTGQYPQGRPADRAVPAARRTTPARTSRSRGPATRSAT